MSKIAKSLYKVRHLLIFSIILSAAFSIFGVFSQEASAASCISNATDIKNGVYICTSKSDVDILKHEYRPKWNDGVTAFKIKIKILGNYYTMWGDCQTHGARYTYDGNIHSVSVKVTEVKDFKAKVRIYIDATKNHQDILAYEWIPLVKTAKFTGTTAVVNGDSDRTMSCNKDSIKIKFDHTVERTDNVGKTALSKVKVKYKAKTKKGDAAWTEYSDWSDRDDYNASLKSGKKKSKKDTVEVKVSKPTGNSANKKRVCEKITYDPKVTFSTKDTHISAPGDRASSDSKCVTVIRTCDGDCYDKYGKDESKWPICGTPGADTKCCRPDEGDDLEPGSSELSASVNQDLLYAGESVSSSYNLTVVNNEKSDTTETTGEEGNSVTVRTEILLDSHDVIAIQFAVPDGVEADQVNEGGLEATEAPGITSASALYSFVNGRIGNVASEYSAIGSGISGATSNRTGGNSSTAPDMIAGRSGVGGKYCTAAVDTTYHNKRITTTTVTTTEDEDGNETTTRDVIVEEFHDLDPEMSVASNVECRPIAKKPYFQIENASTYGSGPISTYDTTTKRVNSTIYGGGSSRSFGSWTEYLLVGKNYINKVTSGAALANSIISNPLTIANKGNKLGYSNVNNTGFAQAVADYYQNGSGKNESKIVSEDPLTVSNVGDFGTNQVLINDGDINIDGDIYADSGRFASNNDTTQHLIISTSGNINIAQNVRNVDAWLIAPEGNINTCDNTGPEECTDPQLTINGLVTAANISFERSYGMETPLGNAAAERVIFSPITYLWGYQQASKRTGQASTVFTRELAPRQ